MSQPPISKPTTVVDSRGTMCPGPITDLFRAFRNSNIGDVLELWATDPAAKSDVQAWARRSGNEVVSITDENGYAKIQVRIVKKGIAR
jgi:tRNA 2-thiouridine synthesizing protein A